MLHAETIDTLCDSIAEHQRMIAELLDKTNDATSVDFGKWKELLSRPLLFSKHADPQPTPKVTATRTEATLVLSRVLNMSPKDFVSATDHELQMWKSMAQDAITVVNNKQTAKETSYWEKLAGLK